MPWPVRAGERLCVVDIFDEVEEDLRAERAEKLLKKYAPHILGAAVAIVAASGGWQLWNRHKAQQDAAAASQFIAETTALEQAGSDKAARLPAFEQLIATAPEGYKVLAELRAAAIMADAGDLSGALKLWSAVAEDAHVDPVLRDFATLMSAARTLDQADPSLLEARLKPLAEPGKPWAPLAREQLAILDLRQGKTADARSLLQALAFDIDAPSGLRARVSALLAGLGTQETK
jgi:hypothetical protein